MTFFCRALYDYDSSYEAAPLTFQRGAIIEVVTCSESGWWDGIYGSQRGWFPCNYVEVIGDDEVDAAFDAAEDYWIPSLTGSLQIVYWNTTTGERTPDLPMWPSGNLLDRASRLLDCASAFTSARRLELTYPR